MNAQPRPIGALSRETGVKAPTIRFYEQIGLMPAPPRTASARRLYDETARRRLAFIKHARDLGFPVEAVRSLLDLADQPDRSCADADRLATEHLAEVERKIAQLQALRDELARVTAECSHGRVAECRVIEVLSDHALCLADQHR
jgi:DNA-binding transcriptional MerR regulator